MKNTSANVTSDTIKPVGTRRRGGFAVMDRPAIPPLPLPYPN